MRTDQAIRMGWIGILINLMLFGLKFWAGAVSGSVAFTADAWHSLSDSVSSLLVIVGIWLSQRPADRRHPFGHGRYELITTILIGCLLAMISYNFLMESADRLRDRQMAQFGWQAIMATVVAMLVKEGLAQYAFRVSRSAGSPSVAADGWNHRTDAISSGVVLVGILVGAQVWWVDGALGIAISLLIFHAAWIVIRGASDSILGEHPPDQLVEQITRIARDTAGQDVWVHHIQLHNYVTRKEVTFHIHLPDAMTIEEASRIATGIGDSVRQQLQINATIHIDPLSHRAQNP